MESGLPLLHCLLQHTLRSICSSSTPSSSKWVYAVFWRMVPRNFPPPRWEFGGTSLDRSKGNKRNWILVWEDGFCDLNECQQGRNSGCLNNDRFGAEVFFKMSHEVYNYGEGLLGKVASENSHKWIYSDTQNGCESSYVASWNASIDHQPRAWEFQFNSGIQTVAVIAVREGLVQLGSFNKIAEDFNIVLSIQRKFSYLQSIPGVFSIQRPYISKTTNFHMMENNEIDLSNYNMNQMNGFNRVFEERSNYLSMAAINMGRNNNNTLQDNNGTQGSLPLWSGPSSLPNMSLSLGALLSRIPNEVQIPYCYNSYPSQVPETNRINSTGQRVKVEECGFHVVDDDGDQKRED